MTDFLVDYSCPTEASRIESCLPFKFGLSMPTICTKQHSKGGTDWRVAKVGATLLLDEGALLACIVMGVYGLVIMLGHGIFLVSQSLSLSHWVCQDSLLLEVMLVALWLEGLGRNTQIPSS